MAKSDILIAHQIKRILPALRKYIFNGSIESDVSTAPIKVRTVAIHLMPLVNLLFML